MSDKDDKTATNIGKRGIREQQDDGEQTHPQGTPVPGAFGNDQHEETQAPHTSNTDKALEPK